MILRAKSSHSVCGVIFFGENTEVVILSIVAALRFPFLQKTNPSHAFDTRCVGDGFPAVSLVSAPFGKSQIFRPIVSWVSINVINNRVSGINTMDMRVDQAMRCIQVTVDFDHQISTGIDVSGCVSWLLSATCCDCPSARSRLSIVFENSRENVRLRNRSCFHGFILAGHSKRQASNPNSRIQPTLCAADPWCSPNENIRDCGNHIDGSKASRRFQ